MSSSSSKQISSGRPNTAVWNHAKRGKKKVMGIIKQHVIIVESFGKMENHKNFDNI
jgi:hypothetical protein